MHLNKCGRLATAAICVENFTRSSLLKKVSDPLEGSVNSLRKPLPGEGLTPFSTGR